MTGEDAEEEARNRTAENETRDRTRTYWQSIRSQGRRAFLSTVGIAGVGAAGAYAQRPSAKSSVTGGGDGENPTEIGSCVVIDEPGEYELVDDIERDEPGGCIVIQASDVVLRGNGHTLTGRIGIAIGPTLEDFSDPQSTEEVPEPPDPLTNVTVKDLEVRGSGVGIRTRHISDSMLSGITAREKSFAVQLSDATRDTVVCDCVVVDNHFGIVAGGDPFEPFFPTSVEGNTYEHNEIARNRYGISMGGESFDDVIRMNRITDNEIGIDQSGEEGVEGHEYHDNVICRNERWGVSNWVALSVRDGGGVNILNATDNYWGAANGPSTGWGRPESVADPETGRLADGDGDAIAPGPDGLVANVRFDPFRAETIDEAGPRD